MGLEYWTLFCMAFRGKIMNVGHFLYHFSCNHPLVSCHYNSMYRQFRPADITITNIILLLFFLAHVIILSDVFDNQYMFMCVCLAGKMNKVLNSLSFLHLNVVKVTKGRRSVPFSMSPVWHLFNFIQIVNLHILNILLCIMNSISEGLLYLEIYPHF